MSSRPTDNSALEPTVIYDGPGRQTLLGDSQSNGASAAKVGLVAGVKNSLSRETADLLRARLRAITLVLSAGLALFLIRLLVVEQPALIWLRITVLAMSGACYWYLRGQRELGIAKLRAVELVVLAVVGVQTVSLQVVGMLNAAAQGDAMQATGAAMFAYVTWIVLIMAYGIFIPNTWRRSAKVLVPAALIPLSVTGALYALDEQVLKTTNVQWITASTLLTCIAAIASVFGTYTVNALRREAYKARQFGQYRLKERLGYGGMGEVYLAEHQLLKRPSAIKLIRPGYDSDFEAIARFELEVQATAKLSHFNTVEIFDYGRTEDGTFYYVMEYLPGLSLAEIVRRHGPLPPERVVHFVRQTCGALSEAHNAGLIHRDIKPGNIFAAKRGGKWDVAKLLDFGLAQETSRITSGEAGEEDVYVIVSGTPPFMSPEQVNASGPPDARSDIYSLGATAYCLLTCRPPFCASSAEEVMDAHVKKKAAPPSLLNALIPPDLEEVVLCCLEKDATNRFASAADLEQALAQCACADLWNDADAAEWWANADGEARPVVSALPLALSTRGGDERSATPSALPGADFT